MTMNSQLPRASKHLRRSLILAYFSGNPKEVALNGPIEKVAEVTSTPFRRSEWRFSSPAQNLRPDCLIGMLLWRFVLDPASER